MILFQDGCSHYATAQLALKWTSVDSTNATFAIAAEGRAASCIRKTCTANGDSGFTTFSPLWTQNGTWTSTESGCFGLALKIDSLTTVEPGLGRPNVFEASGGFFSVYNGSWQMFTCAFNQNGTISLYRITGSTTVEILATSLRAVSDATFAYLEFKWVLSTDQNTTNGSMAIRSNGNQILTYSGVLFPNPSPFAPPTRAWNSIKSMGTASTTTPFLVMRACDHYLIDLEPGDDPSNPNDDFLGDVVVSYIKPDGAGANTDWVPSAGANWQCVDEVPPNSDTDYISSAVATDRDTYTFENITGNPLAIQVCMFTRKTSASGASIAAITRQSATDFDGPDHGIGATTYAYELQPYDTNPDTSLRWTESEINAGEWGPLKSA